ncbi:MAG: threonine--tRNA ligase [Deltaproteobacteria bacterium]|nr:threonine--tRNA ligase [Deltaproteobacteria bacterium]
MSDQVQITLPDGSVKPTAKGTSIFDFIKTSIGAGLAKAALFAKVDGKELDLSTKLQADGKMQVITNKSPEGLDLIRHDAAHVMASVVQKLFPGTQVTIGPSTEDGFYYDFFRETPFTPDDLEKIEKAANEMVKADLPFTRSEVSKDEAIQLFQGKGEKFKVEIVEDIFNKGAQTLSLYSHGDWVDFCLGPHAPSTGKIGVIKLLSVAGAYWRGDPRNPMLQRIYGTAFFNQKDLDAYLHQLEEAKKRDHRRLGKELELFTFHPYAPGSAFWLPKGTTLYNLLVEANRTLCKANGYTEVKTPLLFNKKLWETSGHWGKYKENMFLVLDNETGEHESSLKPMNCPSHHLLYGMQKRSYRELPIRFLTYDVLHRNEAAGALSGLTRVRQFSQDDSHVYVREDQVADEVARMMGLVKRVMGAVGLQLSAKLATRPAERLGDDALWDRAEAALEKALKVNDMAYTLNAGDGAFYGPKIDFSVTDSLGRAWQLATIQYDPLAPERFDLTYVGEDNAPHRPVVLHRAIYGSMERFIAILVEHYAGVFPVWLAPVQCSILTVSDKFLEYGRSVKAKLEAAGIRVELDERGEKLGAKIREAQLAKVPYALVCGEKEQAEGGVSPRKHGGEDLKLMKLDDFIARITSEARVPFLDEPKAATTH